MRIPITSDYIIPNNLSKQALKNGLFLDVRTATDVYITLPKIGVYPNLKIVILDSEGNGTWVYVVPHTDAETTNTIDGESTFLLSGVYDSVTLNPVSDNSWSCITPFNNVPQLETVVLTFAKNGTGNPTVNVIANSYTAIYGELSAGVQVDYVAAGSSLIRFNSIVFPLDKFFTIQVTHGSETDPLQTAKYIGGGQFEVKNINRADGTLKDFETLASTYVTITSI